MTGRFAIEDVTPVVACGRYPAKAVVGEIVPISATVYREGHDALGVQRGLAGPGRQERPFTRMARASRAPTAGTPPSAPDAVGAWTLHDRGLQRPLPDLAPRG